MAKQYLIHRPPYFIKTANKSKFRVLSFLVMLFVVNFMRGAGPFQKDWLLKKERDGEAANPGPEYSS